MKKKIISGSIHVLIWSLIIFIPYWFAPNNSSFERNMLFHGWTAILFAMILFYINYLYLINKLLFSKKILIFLLFNFTIILMLAYGMEIIRMNVFQFNPPDFPINRREQIYKGPSAFKYVKDFFPFVITLCIAVAIKSTNNWFKSETLRKRIENENLHSEIALLKYQLQPHFFFNTLNNIYVLVEKSPELAQKSIHNLSKLMRYVLHESQNEFVALSKEIEFVKNFINLMKIRHNKDVVIREIFQTINSDISIHPLLFITLVENAFKHGISSTENSFIEIRFIQTPTFIEFITINSCFPKSGDDKSGSGIGITNLEKRLNILYPNKYKLKLNQDKNLYTAMLKIYL